MFEKRERHNMRAMVTRVANQVAEGRLPVRQAAEVLNSQHVPFEGPAGCCVPTRGRPRPRRRSSSPRPAHAIRPHTPAPMFSVRRAIA